MNLISQIERGELEVWIRPGTGDITYQNARAYKPELIRLAKLGQQRDWIPVTPETMPEDGKQVLIYSALTKKVGVSDVVSELVKFHQGYFTVTHWMPLPALPEQEGR